MTDATTTTAPPADPADTPAAAPESAAEPTAETTPGTGPDETQEADQGDDSAEKGDADEKAGGKANREAARYRTQLREAETERDQLRTQLTAMRRAEVLRVAGDQLRNGEDLLVFRGDDVTGYLAEDGTVDAEKVKAAADELLKERGYLRPMPPGASGGEFFGGPSLATRRQNMGDIFRG